MKKLMMTACCVAAMAGNATAQTKEQCLLEVQPASKRAVGALGGGLSGALVGSTACSGFLGFVLFDFGVTYATCVAMSTAVGSGVGTVIGDSHATEEIAKCQRLPSKREFAQN